MKFYITILSVLALSTIAFGQTRNKIPKNYVELVVNDGETTSELLPMPIGMSPNLSGAEVGIKYHGVQSESDISFILFLSGTKNRYSAQATFGVKLYSDDIPLSKNRYRMIDSVDKDMGKENLHFYIKAEELAWLAMANSIKIEIYNADTEQKYDMLAITPTGMTQFKKFAKSVLLIRSISN
jgi:hypothetical protein